MKMTSIRQWFAAAVVAGAGVWSAQAAMTHSAAVVDTRADVLAEILPASCAYALDADAVLTVTFKESVNGKQYVLPDNMGSLKLDLNGQTLVGKAGTEGTVSTAGGNGAWVFKVGSGTTISVLDGAGSAGRITGGKGGNGQPAGAGAFAFVDASGAEFAVADAQTLVSKGADGHVALPTGGDAYMVTHDGVCEILGTGATGEGKDIPEGVDRGTITSATIGEGVTEIGARFFKDFRKMKRIEGGAGLLRFGEKAFYRCLDLEEINIANPDFDMSSLGNAVVYQMAIDKDGDFYMVPKVTVAGYTEMLYGKRALTDANWTELGPVGEKQMTDYGDYRFFKVALKKIGE